MPFKTASKRIKCLGINLTRRWKTYTLKTIRYWWKRLKKIQISGNMFHAHELEELVFSKCPYNPTHSTVSMWSLSKFPWHFPTEMLLSHSLVSLVSPWTAACQASLSFTISQSLLKLMSMESVMPSNHPLLFLPSIFPSIRVFSNESVLCIRWLKYWSFSISPSNEYSGLISFRIDWFDLLAVQGTFKSLLQNHNSKALTLQHSAFFMAQLSHLCMTTGKIIALTERLLAKWCLCFLICCLSLS